MKGDKNSSWHLTGKTNCEAFFFQNEIKNDQELN